LHAGENKSLNSLLPKAKKVQKGTTVANIVAKGSCRFTGINTGLVPYVTTKIRKKKPNITGDQYSSKSQV